MRAPQLAQHRRNASVHRGDTAAVMSLPGAAATGRVGDGGAVAWRRHTCAARRGEQHAILAAAGIPHEIEPAQIDERQIEQRVAGARRVGADPCARRPDGFRPDRALVLGADQTLAVGACVLQANGRERRREQLHACGGGPMSSIQPLRWYATITLFEHREVTLQPHHARSVPTLRPIWMRLQARHQERRWLSAGESGNSAFRAHRG